MEEVRTDAELLAAVKDGDRDGLREFHDRHAPWVTSRLRRRCGDLDVVTEAVQDTFVAVWKSARRWDGRGEPAAWVWGSRSGGSSACCAHRNRWAPVAASTDARRRRHRRGRRGPGAARCRARRPGRRARRSSHPSCAPSSRRRCIDGLTTREAGRLLGDSRRNRKDARDARPTTASRSTGMTTWHASPTPWPTFADRPRAGRPDASRRRSSCTCCMRRVPSRRRRGHTRADAGTCRGTRSPIASTGRRRRCVERLLRRLGVTDTLARLVGATPALQLAWLGALVAIVAGAVLAAQQPTAPDRSSSSSPLVPLVAVAARVPRRRRPRGRSRGRRAGRRAPVSCCGGRWRS